MEFPGLGEHCSLVSCKRLDFLPMNCDGCNKMFCTDHVTYDSHHCQGAYKKDIQVPVCPLCNKPIPVKRGEPPDIKVGEHIDQDCQSDPAKEKRKLNANKCSAKGCKKNELIPVLCESCRRNYCLRHRHAQDHDCPRVRAQNTTPSTSKATKPVLKQSETKRKPQQTSLSVLGRDLDRARRERSQPSTSNRPQKATNQPVLSEDEALALAIQESLSESSSGNKTSSSDKPLSQEEEDSALAQAIADSEKEARQNQRQQQTNQRRNDGSSCTTS